MLNGGRDLIDVLPGLHIFKREYRCIKNKNHSRSLANLREVLNKKNMAMAGANFLEMR